ncbi:MAG: GspH/FimT family protein [Phycisphaerae bacterium]|nr:GspH/FimT family protein [Phycisphaerae bacterium]
MMHRHPRSGRDVRVGFTLVEILAVIVILAIVAVAAVPYAVGTSDMAAVSAARKIAAAMEYAQSEAITAQEPIQVSFDTSAESFELLRANTSATLIHPMTQEAYRVEFGSEDGLGDVDIASADFGGAAFVEFDELGAPVSGGTVTVQVGSYAYDVSVASATGRVTVTEQP